MDKLLEDARIVATSQYNLTVDSLTLIESGRVNASFKVVAGDQAYNLQRLNDFFESYPALGNNWLLTQKAFTQSQLPFPGIVPDGSGDLLSRYNGAWRLTQWLPGQVPKSGSLEVCHLAGRFLGLAHRALNVPQPLTYLEKLPPKWEFTNQRLPSPADFENIFLDYRRHPNLGLIAPAIIRATERAKNLPTRPSFTRVFLARDMVIHGDPKRENFLEAEGAAGGEGRMALVDWDTVGYGDLLIDLGELCRSFSVEKPNPAFKFDLALAALKGYLETGVETLDRIALLLPAVIRALSLCLIRRYLIDALAEVYFSWDPKNFDSLFAQNEARALALLEMIEDMEDLEMEFTKAILGLGGQ
ncbi:MAG: phosphotransferase [Deltaproteobacteria bacterium]|jgi:Ser/Thr protein kinase RdoA (MazF antagonist)|nr:phosphotransferase [Deltaproteobacteria bacterium]